MGTCWDIIVCPRDCWGEIKKAIKHHQQTAASFKIWWSMCATSGLFFFFFLTGIWLYFIYLFFIILLFICAYIQGLGHFSPLPPPPPWPPTLVSWLQCWWSAFLQIRAGAAYHDNRRLDCGSIWICPSSGLSYENETMLPGVKRPLK
jgi:hypothetical protein